MESRVVTYNPAHAQKAAVDRIAFCLSIFLNALDTLASKSITHYSTISTNLNLAINRPLPLHVYGLPNQEGKNQLSQAQQSALNYVAVDFMLKLANELLELITPALAKLKQEQEKREAQQQKLELEKRYSAVSACLENKINSHTETRKRSASFAAATAKLFNQLAPSAITNSVEKQLERQRLLKKIKKDYFSYTAILRIIFMIRHIGVMTNTTPSSTLDSSTLNKAEEALIVNTAQTNLALNELTSKTELFSAEEAFYLSKFLSAMKCISEPKEISNIQEVPCIITLEEVASAHKIISYYAKAVLENLYIELDASEKINRFSALVKIADRSIRPTKENYTLSPPPPDMRYKSAKLDQLEKSCYDNLQQLKERNFSDVLHQAFINQFENTYKTISRDFRETRKMLEDYKHSPEEKRELVNQFSEKTTQWLARLNPELTTINQAPALIPTQRDERLIKNLSFFHMHKLFRPAAEQLPEQRAVLI